MRNRPFSKRSVCQLAVVVTVLTFGLADRSTWAAEQPPKPAAGQEISEVPGSINRFASDLHGKLSGAQNQVVSPASISTALAMAYSGTAGETAKQIARTMHFGSPPEKLPAAFAGFQPGKPLLSYSFGVRADNNAGYGLKVTEVVKDSPAGGLGLQKDDLILSINEEPIRTVASYVSSIDDSDGTIRIRWFNFERGTVESETVQLKVESSQSEPSTRLEMVNAIWVQKQHPFREKYLDLLQGDYRAYSKELDFQGNPGYACNLINDWVKNKTHGRIEKLLTEDAIQFDCRLVLTNTLYFKGLWELPFPDKQESLDWQAGDRTKSVPSMSQTATVGYKENDLFQAVELPYRDSRLAMVLLLPKPEISWEQFGSRLRTSGFSKALSGFQPKLASIEMPKFSIDTRLSLKEILSPTMPLAFSEDADFSAMVTKGRLKISAVVHQAFIDVDNIGTEAGAATAVSIVTKSRRPEVTFKADRPFVFALHDRDSRAILFLGHLIQP